jgi:transposase
MVLPDIEKWGQTLSDLRRLSIESVHVRTRERFLALFLIGSGQTNATRWASEISRTKETVLGWVHQYNDQGPAALTYQRTGGRPPFLTKCRSNN